MDSATIGIPQRGEFAPPLGTLEPSPEAFGIATPLDPGPSATEAGGSGASGLSNAFPALTVQLAAANATITELNAQLAAARAELTLRSRLRDMAVKNAALEAKQAMQAEIGALHVGRQVLRDHIKHMEMQFPVQTKSPRRRQLRFRLRHQGHQSQAKCLRPMHCSGWTPGHSAVRRLGGQRWREPREASV